MSFEEWYESSDPDELLVLAHDKASPRTMRLFCCACLRRIWSELNGASACRRAVEVAEDYADGNATSQQLAEAAAEADALIPDADSIAQKNARRAAMWSASPSIDAVGICRSVAWGAAYVRPHQQDEERIAQEALLREMMQQCIDPCEFTPESLSQEVTALCQTAYEDREMPSGVLDHSALLSIADVLEQSGISNDLIPDHFRKSEVHVRGCWALDLLIGNN